MKLEKKHWIMLIAGVVILFLVYWFFFRKKKAESGYNENILIFGNDSSYDPAFPELGESGFKTAPTGPIREGVKSCPCGSGSAIHSPQCCKTPTARIKKVSPTKVVDADTGGPVNAANCGTGWAPCYFCNSWDSQGNCNGWVQKCCRGNSVSNVPKLGFSAYSGGESGYVAAGKRMCEKCKGSCVPPCSGSCVEYVPCPGGSTGIPPIP